MSTQALIVANQTYKPEIARRTANFHASIWGDRFITYIPNRKALEAQDIEELKLQVRRELLVTATHSSQQLDLIDAIQRLGLAFHFEKEIEEALQHIFDTSSDQEDDLYNVSLRFRLLRQHGYTVSCDGFNIFKGKNGCFNHSLTNDARGLLALYEAAHLGVHGEDILNEAIAFTFNHLKRMENHLSYPLSDQVSHALKQPQHSGVPWLENRRYISIYQDEPSRNITLLKMAKINFNQVQSLHKEELAEIARWWKDLDFARKLPFARDRVVECYFWIVGVYCEPQYSLARRILTKVIAMTSIIDDIYDSYGTFEELKLFTEAIGRWDIKSMDELPEYMQICYEALLNVYSDIEVEMAKEGWSYRVHYGKEAMKVLVRAYFDEAKWFHENRIPTLDEYMRVALVTSGYSMLTTVSFIGMGNIATKQGFDWVLSHPKIIKASETIGRLMDDVKSHKFEQERGHAPSGVECYIKQYGVSEQEVYEEFQRRVENAWKDINEECLRPTTVPVALLTRILNLSRVLDAIYKEEDGYTHVGKVMKGNVASLLIDPVPI